MEKKMFFQPTPLDQTNANEANHKPADSCISEILLTMSNIFQSHLLKALYGKGKQFAPVVKTYALVV